MRWSQEALDQAIDEALMPAMELVVRAPVPATLSDAQALRSALYNRAKARGCHKQLKFELSGTRVRISKKATQEISKEQKDG